MADTLAGAERDTLDVLRAVFEKADDLITIADPATLRIVDANPAAERVLGYSLAELRELSVLDLHPETAHRQVEVIRDRLDREGHFRIALDYRRRDGQILPAEMSLSRIRVGGRLLTLNVARDVTDRIRDIEHIRRQAAELADAKGFLEALQDRATDGISLVDEDGIVVYINARQARIHGFPREQVIGQHYTRFVLPDQVQWSTQQFARVMAGEEMHARISIPRPDGALVEMDANSVRVEWAGRRYLFALIRDVTEEVRRERELAEAKGMLEAVQEHAQDAMFLFDDQGRFLFINPRAAAMMNRSREQLAGRTWRDFSPPDLLPSREAHWQRLLAGEALHVRERMHRPDGSVLDVDVASNRVAWGGRSYVFSIVRDVSAAVRQAAELAEVHESIRRSRERVVRQQAALVAVTHHEAFPAGDLGATLRHVTELAAETLAIERVSLWRFSRDRGAIVCLDLFERGPRRHSSGLRLEAARFPAYFRALEQTEVIAADDARSDPRTSEFTADYLVPLGISSMMDAPVHVGDRIDGVLCHEHVGAAREFLPDEKTFAVAMSNLVSLAIGRWEQTRLERRLAVQNAATSVLAEAATLEEAAPRILREICRSLDWSVGILWSVDRAAGVLRCIETWAVDPPSVDPFLKISRERTFDPGIGLPGRVWKQARPAWIPDVVRDDNFPRAPIARAAGLHGAFGFPVRLGDEVVGIIEFFSPEIREPDNDLLEMMSSIGSQVGQFIERKRAERDVRDNEAKLSALVQSSSDAIYIKDREGRYLLINPAGCRIVGRPAADVLGHTDDEIFGAEQARRIRELDLRVMETRAPVSYEFPVDAGGVHWLLHITKSPYLSHDGRVLGIIGISRDLSDRKRAEEALRESEERYRSVVSAMSEGVILVGPDGQIQACNASATRILGLTTDELTRRTTFDPLWKTVREDGTPFPQEQYPVNIARLTGRVVTNVVVGVRRPDGVLGWISINAQPVLRANQAPPCPVVASFTDITERKHIEAELRVREEHYRSLIENASDVITIVDADAVIRYQSPSVEREMGWRPDELLGRSALELVHPDDQRTAREALVRAFHAPGVSHVVKVRFRHKNGSYLVIEGVGRFVTDRDGRGTVIINSRDVTERERADGELRFRKTLLETQSDASIDGILLVAPDGRILSFNRRFREIWGIPDEVLATRSDDEAIASVLDKLADPEAFLSRVRYLYAHPDERSRDELRLKSGAVLDRYSTPVRDADGTYYGRVWFFRDITERKRAEDQLRSAAAETRRAYDELKRTQAQLVQSEKLASVGMMVSGVAHEINNPINVIYGNLRLLRDRSTGQPAVVKQMIRDAIKAADEARGVIDVFRNFARDSRSAEPADLNRCVRDTLAVARRQLGKVRVVTDLGRLPPVPCFPGQLNQVLLNLVKNAAEAMGLKGRLRIRTRRLRTLAVIEISDAGPGIPKELRDRIFDPFFSTKQEGMGLGLSISASIIEHHGGRLTLARSSSRGSTFRIELPLKPAK